MSNFEKLGTVEKLAAPAFQRWQDRRDPIDIGWDTAERSVRPVPLFYDRDIILGATSDFVDLQLESIFKTRRISMLFASRCVHFWSGGCFCVVVRPRKKQNKPNDEDDLVAAISGRIPVSQK